MFPCELNIVPEKGAIPTYNNKQTIHLEIASSGPVVTAFTFLLRLRFFRSSGSYSSARTSQQLLEEGGDSFSSYMIKGWGSFYGD